MPEPTPSDHPVELVAADAVRGAVGRFQLKDELARGPLGITFRAFDAKANREITLFFPDVAVGQPLPEILRAAFALEHPNVIGVQEFGIEANRHFAIRAASDGVPLTQWLALGWPGVRQAVSWAKDLALALHYAHDRGTVHGGVNAESIIIEKGRARLAGFAMSEVPPTAVSPEQAQGWASSPAGDQYSLGVVLYQLIVGQHPFGPDPKHAFTKTANNFSKPAFPRDIDPAIPFALEAVILRAIEKAPPDRNPSCADFAVDLQKLLNGNPVSVPIRTVAKGGPPRDCPDCNRRGSVDKTRCLYCNRDLVGLDPIPKKERDPGNDNRSPVSDGDRAALKLVRLGLGLHVLRMVCYLLSVLSLIAATMLSAIDPVLASYVVLAAAVLLVPPPAFGLCGSALAAFGPGRARAKAFVMASLVLDAAGIAAGTILVLFAADPQLSPDPVATPAAALLAVALGIMAWVFWLLHLNCLAIDLDRPSAAYDAKDFIVRGLLYLVAPVLAVAAIAVVGYYLPLVGWLVAALGVGAFFVWVFKFLRFIFEYLAVLNALRDAIVEKIRPPVRR